MMAYSNLSRTGVLLQLLSEAMALQKRSSVNKRLIRITYGFYNQNVRINRFIPLWSMGTIQNLQIQNLQIYSTSFKCCKGFFCYFDQETLEHKAASFTEFLCQVCAVTQIRRAGSSFFSSIHIRTLKHNICIISYASDETKQQNFLSSITFSYMAF